MTDLNKIIEELSKLTVLEAAELAKKLEEEWGVSAAAPVVAVAAASGDNDAAKAEKTEFDVEITAIGDSKINVIKVVRGLTELGLKEAKVLVEAAPKVLKSKVNKEEADKMKKSLEEAGATVTLK